MQYQWIIDLGSHSVKLYRLESKKLVKCCLRSWQWIHNKYNSQTIYEQLSSLLKEYSVKGDTLAIGTAALRKNSILKTQAEHACSRLSIPLHIITQQQEAELIRLACLNEGYQQSYTIIDAGGGSMQIIQPNKNPLFYSFGLSYLNEQFKLTEAPNTRKIQQCIGWLTEQLPKSMNSFIYTGGEKRYLKHLGVQLTQDKCTKADFIELASQLAKKELKELRELSPFDPKWMDGAIASNCLIVALLNNCSEPFFIANNLTITNGLPISNIITSPVRQTNINKANGR